MRLIHSGRLLSDDTLLFPWLTSVEEKQHRGTPENPDTAPQTSTVWLHCSVGPQLEPGEVDETKVQVRRTRSLAITHPTLTALLNRSQKAQLKPLRGFDRLAAAGFSEQDIANIRSQFHAHSSGDYLDQEFTSDEDC